VRHIFPLNLKCLHSLQTTFIFLLKNAVGDLWDF